MLTKKEQAWVGRVQKSLDACPDSLKERAASFTIGDPEIVIIDETKLADIGDDVCVAVRKSNAELARLDFPFQVWSTAG